MPSIPQLVPELSSAAQGRKRNRETSLLAEPEPEPGLDRTLGLSRLSAILKESDTA